MIKGLCDDVKVKRYPMALSLVKLHKQPKYRCQRGQSESVPKVFVQLDETVFPQPPFDLNIM